MASRELIELWSKIQADLKRARSLLPHEAERDVSVREFEMLLGSNELSLACDALEACASEHAVPRDFWLALRDAARKMDLHDRAHDYGSRAHSTGND